MNWLTCQSLVYKRLQKSLFCKNLGGDKKNREQQKMGMAKVYFGTLYQDNGQDSMHKRLRGWIKNNALLGGHVCCIVGCRSFH
jgi:hypothetical protein